MDAAIYLHGARLHTTDAAYSVIGLHDVGLHFSRRICMQPSTHVAHTLRKTTPSDERHLSINAGKLDSCRDATRNTFSFSFTISIDRPSAISLPHVPAHATMCRLSLRFFRAWPSRSQSLLKKPLCGVLGRSKSYVLSVQTMASVRQQNGRYTNDAFYWKMLVDGLVLKVPTAQVAGVCLLRLLTYMPALPRGAPVGRVGIAVTRMHVPHPK